MHGISWRDCTIPWHAPAGDIQVVRVRHDAGDPRLGLAILSASECRRADAYSAEDAMRRFVMTRAVLRRLLGEICGLRPEAVGIDTGRHGKPLLTNQPHGGDIRFNISHSGSLSLIVFASRREVGVDIEETSRRTDIQAVARRFFPTAEADFLAGLADEAERSRVFYGLWTQREALAKAIGSGLNDAVFGSPLQGFDQGSQVVELGRSAWYLRCLDVMPGFAAALALAGRGEPSLSYWDGSTLLS